MTLADSFGRRHSYLRISVTDRCNLRCAYCMPKEGVEWMEHDRILRYEEILRIARVATALGVRKIRVTGGEPLVRRDIEVLFDGLGQLPGLDVLALTTNGVLLSEKARTLRAAGLSVVNISLDTLKRDRFTAMTYRDELPATLAGIDAALAAGFAQVKINAVVMRDVNDDELFDLAELARNQPISVRFIEFMPFDGNAWGPARLVPYAEMLATLRTRYTLTPVDGDPSQTAKDFRVEGFKGTVSFITSMSDSFCGTCDRMRITADGYFKPCLFSSKEISLRDVMRNGGSDQDIAGVFAHGLHIKPLDHAAAIELAGQHNRAMIQIGG